MSTVIPSKSTVDNLQEQARRHLWMHFSRMGGYSDEHEIPIISRGEGAYVYDAHGKKYLDATKRFDRDRLHTPTEAVELVAASQSDIYLSRYDIDTGVLRAEPLPWDTFCTIMSTLMEASDRGPKMLAATPGRSATCTRVIFASSRL